MLTADNWWVIAKLAEHPNARVYVVDAKYKTAAGRAKHALKVSSAHIYTSGRRDRSDATVWIVTSDRPVATRAGRLLRLIAEVSAPQYHDAEIASRPVVVQRITASGRYARADFEIVADAPEVIGPEESPTAERRLLFAIRKRAAVGGGDECCEALFEREEDEK